VSKIGLKLWNINTGNYLREAEKLYKLGLYDYIELYIVPNNTDKINLWKNLNVPFNLHAPHFEHGMNLSQKECFENNLKLYKEVKSYADVLNPEYIIFHAGTDGDYRETARQITYINDQRTVIENKPYKTLPFIKGNYYVGGKIPEIKHIIDTANCKFCLDIGHAISAANALGVEPYTYVEEFNKLNPIVYHISDLDTKSDMDAHLNYGTGNLDFHKIFRIISSNKFITIETNKKSKDNLDNFVSDVKFLKEYL